MAAKPQDTTDTNSDELVSLKAENIALKEELEAVKAESDAKTIVIATLEAELAKQAESLPKPQIATLGGKKYRPTTPAFRWKGTIYTSKDVLENETLLAQLVEMNSGAIEEIQTDEE